MPKKPLSMDFPPPSSASQRPQRGTRRGRPRARTGPRPDFRIEDSVRRRSGDSSLCVAGVDEVGVGALAGPVMAAAVVLRSDHEWLGEVDDSKRLGWRKREELHGKILAEAVAVGVGYANNTEIDQNGIFNARACALTRAYQEVERQLAPAALAAVVDGANLRHLRRSFGGEHSAFVDHADQRSLSVAAASIVAKVLRDRYIVKISSAYSAYGWERNKGYGTPEHFEALKRHGASPLHRKTFAPVREALEKIHR